MSAKAKKTIIICAISIAYYILFFTCKFTVFEYMRLNPTNYQISENYIIVHGQATTGPEIRVVEGAEFLLASTPLPYPDDLNVSEIEMTGMSIYKNLLDYPDYYACDWLVFGKVTGTTDMYEECGSGTIPVFEAEKVYPIMSLSDFLVLETVWFYKAPLGFILALLLYFWPVAAILICINRKEKSHT